MELIDPRFDVVNGGAKAAFKARLLVQAKLPFQFDDRQKMRLILL